MKIYRRGTIRTMENKKKTRQKNMVKEKERLRERKEKKQRLGNMDGRCHG